jgi:hypothetical protein
MVTITQDLKIMRNYTLYGDKRKEICRGKNTFYDKK